MGFSVYGKKPLMKDKNLYKYNNINPLETFENVVLNENAPPIDIDYLKLLVQAVPYNYRLRKFYTRKTPHEAFVYEVDDTHRFRNSVAVTKVGGQSTLQSLSGSRSSTMREFAKKIQQEAEIEAKYLRSPLGPCNNDIKYSIDIVDWEDDVEMWDDLNRLVETKKEDQKDNEDDDSWDENTDDKNNNKNDEYNSRYAKDKKYKKKDKSEDYNLGDNKKIDKSEDYHLGYDKIKNYENYKSYESYDKNNEKTASPDNPNTNYSYNVVKSKNKSDILTNFKHSSVFIREYVNSLLDSNWEKDIYFDPKDARETKFKLYVDDPNIIFEKREDRKKNKGKRKSVIEKVNKSRYNISNDKYYVGDGKKTVPSLGTFGVQHSLTALCLDDTFYRINLSREELLGLHKTPVMLGKNEYTFCTFNYIKVKNTCINDNNCNLISNKKKQFLHELNGGINPNVSGVTTDYDGKMNLKIRNKSELSLCDNLPFYVFEYAEENPFFIVKPGMVSLLNRYYKLSDSGNDTGPDGCIILDNEEENPFFGFGEIRPGTSIQTIANNLFIAPVHPHSVGDYLCIIRDDEIIVREIDVIFLIGQEFPKEEVFAPHSRKLNQFCKDRLKVAAHRAFGEGNHLLMSDLDQMFPYFSEGSKRKWLKEYADCVKKGRDNVWVLREIHQLLNEEDVRKLVTPENICQYESMLICETKMQLMGLRYTENEEENTDSEKFCPSWTLSKNFINAVNGRGLLELTNKNNENDVFFNFRRVRLKKGNEADNRKFLAELQSSYKERINRIWNRQIEFISSSDINNNKIVKSENIFDKSNDKLNDSNFDKSNDKLSDSNFDKSNDKLNDFNFDKSNDKLNDFNFDNTNNIKKDISYSKKQLNNSNDYIDNCLIIKRTYLENDTEVTRIQKIYDPKVIKAYLHAREKVNITEKKSGLTCSNCGQHGHMKTNKTCPNYMNLSRSIKNVQKKTISDKKKAKMYLQDEMGKLLTKFHNMPFSNAFHRPVSIKKFPNYLTIVKNPIDMSTIRTKVRNFSYKNFTEFSNDFKLMLDNCKKYNGPEHSLTEIAENIYKQVCEFAVENSQYISECEKLLDKSDGDK